MTITVPAAVPSDFHNSPWLRVEIEDSEIELAVDVRQRGRDGVVVPGAPLTTTVPAAVPSDFHNSKPSITSSISK